jgi:sugar phosphate isomerase/epimerase
MIHIGIMAKTFERPSLEAVLDAVAAHGLRCLQFNMRCAGLASLPDHIPPTLSDHIGQAMSRRGLTMAAVSGSFNMIHPDPRERQTGLRRLAELAAACPGMGTSLITLCTGSRDPNDMWRRHPDNDSPAAWRDLVTSLEQALPIAERHGLTLAFEPEVANVIDSAVKARRLLDEMKAPNLKVVLDAANLFQAGQLSHMPAILDQAFELLGPDIALAHAKDLSHDGAAGQEAAGTGLLDYDRTLSLLQAAHFSGGLILHSLSEAQVPGCVTFLREKLFLG